MLFMSMINKEKRIKKHEWLKISGRQYKSWKDLRKKSHMKEKLIGKSYRRFISKLKSFLTKCNIVECADGEEYTKIDRSKIKYWPCLLVWNQRQPCWLINHLCAPNCFLKAKSVNGTAKIFDVHMCSMNCLISQEVKRREVYF